MKRPLAFHPLLFALYPILFLFTYNIEEIFFYEIVPAALGVLIFTLLLLLFLQFLLKDIKKSAIIVSLFLIFFFSYGHLYTAISGLRIGGFEIARHRYLFPLYLMSLALCIYFTLKTRKDLNNFTKIMNVISLYLIIITLTITSIYTLKTRTDWFNQRAKEIKTENNLLEIKKPVLLPNIYYIILDGYAASDTLKEYFNFNNYEFTNYLTNKGFYIAANSRSNYSNTYISIASSLNMEYINYLKDMVKTKNDLRIVKMMIKDSKVRHFLKKSGYEFIHIGNWRRAKTLDPQADLIFQRLKNFKKFELIVLHTTMLNPLYDYLLANVLRKNTLYRFSKLAELIPQIKEPTFVFTYIDSPHAPFVFGPNGEETEVFKSTKARYANNWQPLYLDQLIFINRKIEMLVDTILSNSNKPPIIIIQSDHGWIFNDFDRYREKCIKQRMRIFNAYYLPDGGNNLLYDSITPVNSFRLIFKHYFGANIDLLNDRSYYSPYGQLYEFIDVTGYFNTN